MTTVKKSFRLFGNFRVGKNRNQSDAARIPGNCLEIFHAPFGESDGRLRSLARVSVVSTVDGMPAPLTEADLPDTAFNIFLDEAREQILSDLASRSEVVFWISRPLSDEASGGFRLFVFDAIRFDQFKDRASAEPSESFPLVSGHKVAGTARSSNIAFGNGEQDFGLRMELAFPMPVPVGKEADTANATGGALGLGAVFATNHGTDESLVEPFNLLLGPPGKLPHKEVRDWTFGDFGVAETRRAGKAMLTDTLEREIPRMGELLAAVGLGNQQESTGSDHVLEFKSVHQSPGKFLYAAACRRRIRLRNGGNVEINGPAARLDLSEQLGGLLEVDQRSVLVECHWSTEYSDDTLFAALADGSDTPIEGSFRASLRFTSTTGLEGGFVGAPRSMPPLDAHNRLILRGGALEEAARLSNVARTGLVATDRQPQSILPRLSVNEDQTTLQVPLIAYAPGINAQFRLGHAPSMTQPLEALPPASRFRITLDSEWLPLPKEAVTTTRGRNLSTFHLTKEPTSLPVDKRWIDPPAVSDPIEFRMVLPGFNDLEPDPNQHTHHNHIFLAHDPRAPEQAFVPGETSDDEPVVSMSIGNDPASAANPHTGADRHFSGLSARLGSLGFVRGGSLLQSEQSNQNASASFLHIRRRHRNTINPRAAARPMATLEVTWTLKLAVDEAYPVTTDVAHGVRDDRPSDLVIRETPLDITQELSAIAPFHLTVTEKLCDSQDRHLTAELFENTSLSDASRATFTVLTKAPFSVYRFTRQPLASGGDEKPVATFNSDARVWRLLNPREVYQFTRPAGAVGEDADKPGMLELHDPVDRTEPLAPCLPAGKNGIDRRRVVDMRLSPPTSLWVDPSDLKRNFLLPEYAARDLFRQLGDFGLGMRLKGLRGELLYGLAYSVKVPDPQETRSSPRVAEIQALTGRMVEFDPEDTENTSLDRRWKQLRLAFKQRPERLEVWTLDQQREDPFVPARLDSGTRFSLRHTALLAPPVRTGTYTPEASNQPGLEPPRFHDHGLSGGVLWPLESANITRIATANPAATSGELEGVVLSPEGDSGNQTVRFLNGYITVISETIDGRLQKQRVEILGRIAGLWHRAKHVVIYERTTTPSPQFAPYPNQPTRTKRPALRKIEEFVEILEPNRRYPDMPDVPVRSRGCLEEVRFNSTVIHVNSAWGGDVGEQGWEVPLWNRGEAELRPQIYPYPDVAFITTGEGNGPAPQATQECLDVANLYFFTDPVAAEKSPDTNLWPVRYGVDTCGLGDPDTLYDLLDIGGSQTPEGRRPAAGRIVPGLRRFTWRLAPSPTRSRINVGRGDKPIFSGLASVSLLRASGGRTSKYDTIKHALAQRRQNDAQLSALLNREIDLPLSREKPAPGFTRYDNVVTALDALGEAPSEDTLRHFKTQLETLTSPDSVKEIDNILSAHTSVLDDARPFVTGLQEIYDRVNDFDTADCSALADRITGSIRKRKQLCLQMVRQAQTQFAAAVLTENKITRENAATWLAEQVTEVTQDLFDQANRNLGDLQSGIATARAVVADWRNDVHNAMELVRARVDALNRSYDRSKPWSRNRVDKALQSLSRELDAAEQEWQAALEEARLRVSTEIGASANSVGTRITAVIAKVVQAEAQLLDRFQSISDAVDKTTRRTTDILAKIPTQESVDAKLAEIEGRINAIANTDTRERALAIFAPLQDAAANADINTKKAEAITAVDAIRQHINEPIADLGAKTASAANTAETALNDVQAASSAAATAAENFAEEISEEIAELAKDIHRDLSSGLEDAAVALKNELKAWKDETDALDRAVDDAKIWIVAHSRTADRAATEASAAIDTWLGAFSSRLAAASQTLNTVLPKAFEAQVIKPSVNAVFDTVNWPSEDDVEAARAFAIARSEELVDILKTELDRFAALPTSEIKEAEDACKALVGLKTQFKKDLQTAVDEASRQLEAVLAPVRKDIEDVLSGAKTWAENAVKIRDGAENLLGAANEIGNQIADAGENVRAYVDRGAEILARAADAKPSQLPGLALQFVSAATQAPEIAAFRANADRIRVLLNDTKDVLDTPAIRGALDQLGDALKALGLEFNFKEFGDRFIPEFNEDDVLRNLIPDFGGINLKDMLPRAALPSDLKDAVKVTHDLDTKAGRAWVQADVNIPLPAREPMFSIGPFTLFLKNTLLRAFVRAEASKDQDQVALSDKALLLTTIEAVVAGQTMVTLEDVAIRYSSKEKLDFTLDPSKIRIHQTMRFIQDTLGSIFGDELGGLQFIKEGGVPVGVEHKFTMPPLSLMYGTSGVTNLQIANRFSLRAYPDFIIANRFNLSRRELPFVFSVFIIGGTGYIQVDTEYRPFDSRLMVAVEAGVGGSAALGFAFGPVSGSVFITISVVLRYQKQIGNGPRGEEGLSVSLVLVIAGTVSLWGIVSIYLGLMLSIRYHESGQLDGVGQLSVEVRISRWFKLRYSTQVTYKLRDGRSSTQVTSQTSTSGKYKDALEKFEALDRARKSL
ncbi:gas vesicle protein [Labrenzia sp. EL_195]|nr:gas vesicle protein [Labrenzia sp. EL_195]